MAQLKTLNMFVLSDLGLVSIISRFNSSNLWVTTISECQYNADKTDGSKKDMQALGLSIGYCFNFFPVQDPCPLASPQFTRDAELCRYWQNNLSEF